MNNIIIYNTEDGKAKINLILDDGSVWLSQSEIAELFQTTKQNISKHIKSIFQDLELSEEETVNYKLTVQNEGTRTVERKLAYDFSHRISCSIAARNSIQKICINRIKGLFDKGVCY